MSQSRRRWLISIVLVLAVVGFVGFSMAPLITTAFKENQRPQIATSPSGQTPGTIDKSQLENQARGYESVLQREPDNQTALRGLVQARIRLRDLKGAVPPLEKLAALNPNETEVRLVLGQVYATEKQYDEAIAVFDQAIKVDKQDFRPVLAKAVVLEKQGKIEQAKPLFENAAALAPPQYREEINRLTSKLSPTQSVSPAPVPSSSTNK